MHTRITVIAAALLTLCTKTVAYSAEDYQTIATNVLLLELLNKTLLPPGSPARFVDVNYLISGECGRRDPACDAFIHAELEVTQSICVDRGESDVWTWGSECTSRDIPGADIAIDGSYDIKGYTFWKDKFALKWMPGTYTYDGNTTALRKGDRWSFENIGVTTPYTGNITLPDDDYDWEYEKPLQEAPTPFAPEVQH